MERLSSRKQKQRKKKKGFLTFIKIPSRSSSSVSESFAAFLPDFFPPFGVDDDVVDLDLRATLVSLRSVLFAAFAAAAAEVACFLPMIELEH